MMEEAPPDIKRRRISAAGGSPQRIRCLTDLPSGILAHAASFLTEPSRALFAIALDGNSAVSTNERSSAIAGNEWSILDFGGIEEELATKLNDDDIEKVLLCIDAVNKVKRLKLTNCVNITGAGLEPLRGSLIIEQIDLSLVGEHQRPHISPEPLISCSHVLPILDSIIEREGCSLMHLQFPQVWRDEPSAEYEFHAFILRYNQMRGNWEEISCLECNQNLPRGSRNEWIDGDVSDPIFFGTQRHTCYGCMKHYCYSCVTNGVRKLDGCHTCKRDYCVDCIEMHRCLPCNGKNCNDCYKDECHNCSVKFCSDCVEGGHVAGEDKKVHFCDQCSDTCCDDCRFQKFRQGQLDCAECIKLIAPLLVGESLARKQLQEENEQLKVKNKEQQGEIKELKRENKELKLDIKELRSGT
eukprot:scaffold8557_cov100-Skeletonema_dohrnii-CCMP3373.AAC.5